jgi:hypothetical protein
VRPGSARSPGNAHTIHGQARAFGLRARTTMAFIAPQTDWRGTVRNRTFLAVAGLALGLLAFGRSTRLQSDEGGSNLPFMGVAAGQITGVEPSGAVAIESTGNATYLGQFTRTEYAFFGPAGEISGAVVFTAANGDQLWADFSGGFISPTTAEGTYTFTGGTGRFTDATGTASFTATTPDGVHVAISFKGSISY